MSRPDGKTVSIGYDAAGRTKAITHPSGTLSLDYHTDTGQLSSITGADAGITYTYDGSLLTSTSWSGPLRGAVSRTFDNNFWLRSRTVAGVPVTFDYDLDGLLTRAGDLTVARDPASGRITGATLGSVQSTLSYDAFGALESLDTGMGGNSLYAATFQRDRLGRIEVKTETVGALTNVYEYFYDLSGRLERVVRDGTPVEEYSYDENGNRLSAVYPWGAREGTYDAQDRLLTYGDATFTYTEAGELLTRSDATGTTYFEYDVFGNLIHVELPIGDVIEYLVDGQNRRIGRKLNGTLVQGVLYKDALNPIAELDGNGVVVSRFVYGTRAHVPDYMIRGGVTYRIIADHLGSVRLVVDAATGEIAQRLDYDSFGRVTLDTNPGFQPFGFAGGVYDPFTGLVRFGARDYSSEAGRWTNKDPILFAGRDSNLFAYVVGDPVNSIDPLGLARKCSRPLAGPLGALSKIYPGAGSSRGLDKKNREPLHEHFWFPDGSNTGFFPSGVGPDDAHDREDYVCEGRRYDPEILSKAIESMSDTEEYSIVPAPGRPQYNCQDWADEVIHEYERLRMKQTLDSGRDPEIEYVWQQYVLGGN